ncbi:MAG: hypothetical protein AB2L18_11720 [Anaerolineaceae bacterium]
MTLPTWNVNDYVFDFKDVFYSGPLVNAPIELKVDKVITYLNELVFPDAITAIMQGAELSGTLLSISTVEYLAGYFSGKQAQQKDFIAFVNRYFPEPYPIFINDIYTHIRCGLFHNLSIINPWNQFENEFLLEMKSDGHLKLRDGKIVFSVLHFVEDTRRSMIMYFYDLIMKKDINQELINNFNKRFNKQDGVSSIMIKI